jgi:hypothetical protein
VRALFPTTNLGATVGGAFFNPQPDLLTLSAPAQARGTRSGARLVVQWAPDQAAKQYEVDVSTTPSFSTIVSQQRVDGPTWSPDINPVVLHPSRGTLYWRVAALDSYYTAGSFASGRFKSPPKHRRHK